MSRDFENALQTAALQLQQALMERDALDKRILELRQVVASLSVITEQDSLEKSGGAPISTDEVRNIVYAHRGKVMDASDVLGELRKLGCDLGKYKNPQATIGVILNRLRDSGEVTPAAEVGTNKRGFVALPRPPHSAMTGIAPKIPARSGKVPHSAKSGTAPKK